LRKVVAEIFTAGLNLSAARKSSKPGRSKTVLRASLPSASTAAAPLS
jgi:hypothetical protein